MIETITMARLFNLACRIYGQAGASACYGAGRALALRAEEPHQDDACDPAEREYYRTLADVRREIRLGNFQRSVWSDKWPRGGQCETAGMEAA